MIAFTGVLLAKLIGTYGIAPGYAFVIALLMGASFGALMGWIIDVLKLPAFIITLAGMFFVRGMSFIVSEESLPNRSPAVCHAGKLCLESPRWWPIYFIGAGDAAGRGDWHDPGASHPFWP